MKKLRAWPSTPFAAVILLSMGSVICANAASAEAPRFVQDQFEIGLWWPPQTDERLADRYKELAQANFTLVVGTYGTNVAQQLKLCKKVGLAALVSGQGPASKLPQNEACLGYLLADEPGPAAFPELAKRVAEIRKDRPGRLAYVNLFPNYAPAWALGGTYDEHLAKFVREVKPDVLSMDHYPVMRPEADGRDDYCANLESMRHYSTEAGIPFWNYFYCMPFGDRLDPTEAQIRWQIFASIAYGAKGVLYFCYWTPGKGAHGGGEFPKGGAIITAEGLRTRHYEEARRINAELKNLGPTLMKLTCTGVYRVKTDKEPEKTLAGSPLRKLSHLPGDPPAEYIVGAFRHADGRRAVLILNHSYTYNVWPQVEFDAKPEEVTEVSKASGKAAAVVDDSPELAGLQLSIGAGDARLFLLPAAK